MKLPSVIVVLLIARSEVLDSDNVALNRSVVICGRRRSSSALVDGDHSTKELLPSACDAEAEPHSATVELDGEHRILYLVISPGACTETREFVSVVVTLGDGQPCNNYHDKLRQCKVIYITCASDDRKFSSVTVKVETAPEEAYSMAEIEVHAIASLSERNTVYVGCFIIFQAVSETPLTTVENCNLKCSGENLPYVALDMLGARCSCGDSFDREVSRFHCDVGCQSEYEDCSTTSYKHVYMLRLNLPYKHGCISVDTESPMAHEFMTIGYCLIHCDESQFAVIKQKDCFCLDDIAAISVESHKQCTEECQEAPLCGGPSHGILYRTCYDGSHQSTKCTNLFRNCETKWEGPGFCTGTCGLGFTGPMCLDTVFSACESTPCPLISSTCLELPDLMSYSCVCRPDHVRHQSGTCVKADCSNACDPATSTCEMIDGRAKCTCRAGHLEVAGKCLNRRSLCQPNPCNQHISDCQDKPEGGYMCRCMDGYRQVDDYKCVEGPSHCSSLPCDYRTSRCREVVESGFDCRCLPGFMKVDRTRCVNGSLYCDYNSCNRASATCQQLSNGKFRCRCKPGFVELDLYSCFKESKCAGDPCRHINNSACLEWEDSYVCVCTDGFLMNEEGVVCEDIDECSFDICDSKKSECHNEIGDFSCHCKPGFVNVTKEICLSNTSEKVNLSNPFKIKPAILLLASPFLTLALMTGVLIFLPGSQKVFIQKVIGKGPSKLNTTLQGAKKSGEKAEIKIEAPSQKLAAAR